MASSLCSSSILPHHPPLLIAAPSILKEAKPGHRSFRIRKPSVSLISEHKHRLVKFFQTVPQSSKVGSVFCRSMAASTKQDHVLDSKSEPPPLFDGTTRLYYASRCPYAQRVWIARNFKGLDEIQLVEISLTDKPAWYKERVYSVGKVPALEHNGKVLGESLDLLEYLEHQFQGAPIFPLDPSKKEIATELIEFTDKFSKAGYTALSLKDATHAAIEEIFGPALNHLEANLGKFADGAFFLGTFSAVDIAYAPFTERFQLVLLDFHNYDITEGRPKLKKWIEALNQIEAYETTKMDPQALRDLYRKMLDEDYFTKIGMVSQTKTPQAAAD